MEKFTPDQRPRLPFITKLMETNNTRRVPSCADPEHGAYLCREKDNTRIQANVDERMRALHLIEQTQAMQDDPQLTDLIRDIKHLAEMCEPELLTQDP